MSRQAFAHIRNISTDLSDPGWASWVINNLFCSNLKLTRQVLITNLLTKLMKLGIGTNEVEHFASRVGVQK